MKYVCGKCFKAVEGVEGLEPMPGAEGVSFHCLECSAPVLYMTYEELEQVEEGEPAELPEGFKCLVLSPDQQRYLEHIIDKQLSKLDDAANQLLDILDQLT